MIDEKEVLELVVKRLVSAHIPYMVTGSVAANFYATPRMTRDIDIIIEVQKDDAQKLFSLFSDDFYVDEEAIINAINRKRMFNIIHNEGIVKVDFIIKKDSEYRVLEFRRKRRLIFEGMEIDITAPEDLILSKLYWAKESMSEMQISDVRNLLMMVSDLDMAYMEKWVKELGLARIYEKARP